MDLQALIRAVPDFPKPGILFRDITPILQSPEGLRAVVLALAATVPQEATAIVGVESRGFIFGAPLAHHLGISFVPVRKPGKLPAAIHRVEYALEYGQDCLEIHQDALSDRDQVVIVDDLLATGGTAAAAATLVQHTGAELLSLHFVIELTALQGRQRLPKTAAVYSLINYDN